MTITELSFVFCFSLSYMFLNFQSKMASFNTFFFNESPLSGERLKSTQVLEY